MKHAAVSSIDGLSTFSVAAKTMPPSEGRCAYVLHYNHAYVLASLPRHLGAHIPVLCNHGVRLFVSLIFCDDGDAAKRDTRDGVAFSLGLRAKLPNAFSMIDTIVGEN